MNTKWSVYPAVVVACLLSFIGLALVWLQFTIAIEPIGPDTSSLPKTMPPKPQTESGGLSTDSKTTQLAEQNTLPSTPEPTGRKGGQGALRISNQTDQSVRVALLAQRSTATGGQPAFATPVHWDFAPGEGSRQGLILSLPKGNLKLRKGDILVAFAQDGSRRYWGPYVVGETPMPTWNQRTSEWQMVLPP